MWAVAPALVTLALIVWLLPVGDSTTTVRERSTTTVAGPGAQDRKRTEAAKTGTTIKPEARRSETVVAALVGTGAVLFIVFAFWGRITEIGLPGGGSIKLTEAEAPAIDVEDVAAAIQDQLPEVATLSAAGFAQMMTSSSLHITEKTKEIAITKDGVVLIDLGAGDKWLLPNLYFLALMLERWTCVSLLVFTKLEDEVAGLYVACVPPSVLRERLEQVRAALGQARVRVADVSLDQAGSRSLTGSLKPSRPMRKLSHRPG